MCKSVSHWNNFLTVTVVFQYSVKNSKLRVLPFRLEDSHEFQNWIWKENFKPTQELTCYYNHSQLSCKVSNLSKFFFVFFWKINVHYLLKFEASCLQPIKQHMSYQDKPSRTRKHKHKPKLKPEATIFSGYGRIRRRRGYR